MTRATFTRILFAAAIFPAVLGTTCGGLGIEDDTGAPCGTRTVVTLPPPGYLRTNFNRTTYDVTPKDAGLGKVLLPDISCQFNQEGSEDVIQLFQVDAIGNVLRIYTLTETDGEKTYTSEVPTNAQRVALRDNCLVLLTSMGAEDPSIVPGNDSGYNPCPDGQVAIGPNGTQVTADDGEFICVDLLSTELCIDCQRVGDTWTQEMTASGIALARGTIEDVQATEFDADCEPVSIAVDIEAGDAVEYATTNRVSFSVSDSPEALGYSPASDDDADDGSDANEDDASSDDSREDADEGTDEDPGDGTQEDESTDESTGENADNLDPRVNN